MAYLTTQQRNILERAVVAARKAAELGARNALISLAVDQTNAFSSLTPEKMNLREQLRNKARLLGDVLGDGSQSIDHLVNELAYEYWHKMLFARFLEANNLLMHPDGVPVSMEDCEELATEMGLEDKWDVASTFASRMLPAIFRPNDPVLQIRFASNDRIKLESILDDIETVIFVADDSLGWVYQFWQNEAKAAINADGEKIDGEKLPAVTQLFTEPYMVHFLIDNTIGAWWVSRNKDVTPPVKFEFLRLLDDGTPAVGSYQGWPDESASLTVMDPCMGSGHFIVAVFIVLVELRMFEENLSVEDAIDRVIVDNIYGLELDPRCTQLSAFNLALVAWKHYGGYRELPAMNLACSGIAPNGKIEDWITLVDNNTPLDTRVRLENGMAMLHHHFQLAPELGSLLDPTILVSDAFIASYDELLPSLKKALSNEIDEIQAERGVLASGIAKVGSILGRKYTLQITNVPYLARGKQGAILSEYCKAKYPDSKGDLATVFLERMMKTCDEQGAVAIVIPQNWLFLSSYRAFRKNMLENSTLKFILMLGSGAFRQITGEVVKPVLVGITRAKPSSDNKFYGGDVSDAVSVDQKIEALYKSNIIRLMQKRQLLNPDSRVVIGSIAEMSTLAKYAKGLQGISPADLPHFGRKFWELEYLGDVWKLWQSSSSGTGFYEGRQNVLWWGDDLQDAFDTGQAYLRGQEAWGKRGIVVRQVSDLPITIYTGERHDTNCAILLPEDETIIPALWCYCSSRMYYSEVRKIDRKLNVTNATLVKVPFDKDYWIKEAAIRLPNGIPDPYSDDPTQWLYHGHPIRANYPLQICVARFLGYRFPAEDDDKIAVLSDESRCMMQMIKQHDHLSDIDGIICLPSVNGEYPASDRIRDYGKAVFAEKWDHSTETKLLLQERSNKSSIAEWLRDEFFECHCQLFQNRPFIWHIWDCRKDGFSALVNYHKLTKENLQKLIYGYLGDWIRQCESKVKTGESGAEGLVVAATTLQNKLKMILEGEPPYDIFVRWKPLHEQPMGWEPDLNDGVRINIRPFIEAGVLRKKVKIKYGIDRGKNAPGSPWGEIRDNDKHLTLAEKREAREKRKEK